MRVKIERALFISLFFVIGNLNAFAQTVPTTPVANTGLQGIFGNLNIDEAKKAETDFKNKSFYYLSNLQLN